MHWPVGFLLAIFIPVLYLQISALEVQLLTPKTPRQKPLSETERLAQVDA